MKILAFESSCDETAAAVVEDGRNILSSVIHTQIEEHKLYGGVVPELASRRHVESISAMAETALEESHCQLADIDAIAVTAAPGLIGAVLIGVNFAKGLAFSAGKPLIPVHHIRGHVAANYCAHPNLTPPFMALIVSGGHSHIVKVRDYCDYDIIGRTTDDAAGEAFDKAARCVGLPYPGGVALDNISREGNPHAFPLPTPHAEGLYNFSFSGLKTAVLNLTHNADQKGEPIEAKDLAATFCRQVSDILWQKTEQAMLDFHESTLVLAGGVSANSWLREKVHEGCQARGWSCYMPPLTLTGDNAAMIGAQAYYEYQCGHLGDWGLNGLPTMEITENF